jgi:hypothetical protein
MVQRESIFIRIRVTDKDRLVTTQFSQLPLQRDAFVRGPGGQEVHYLFPAEHTQPAQLLRRGRGRAADLALVRCAVVR